MAGQSVASWRRVLKCRGFWLEWHVNGEKQRKINFNLPKSVRSLDSHVGASIAVRFQS
jgi:hypothetical protein